MRIPFNFDKTNFEEDARIKFSYTSPELHQNIEISIDSNELSIDALLETFERFISALGVSIPDDVVVGFIRVNDEEGDEDDDEGDDDDEDQDGGEDNEPEDKPIKPKSSKRNNKEK